jgi:hypothetical protein
VDGARGSLTCTSIPIARQIPAWTWLRDSGSPAAGRRSSFSPGTPLSQNLAPPLGSTALVNHGAGITLDGPGGRGQRRWYITRLRQPYSLAESFVA